MNDDGEEGGKEKRKKITRQNDSTAGKWGSEVVYRLEQKNTMESFNQLTQWQCLGSGSAAFKACTSRTVVS